MSASARRAVALALLAAAWASAGTHPLLEAAAGAPLPIDFARDYVAAHARLHGVDDEALDNAYAARIGVPGVARPAGGAYHAHPPPATFVVLPLVPLGFAGAARVWLALSLIGLAVLAYALVELASRGPRPPPAVHAVALVLLAVWPPVLHSIAKGQWSILLAALLAAGALALVRGRPRAAGVLMGLAASLKATPVLVLGLLLLRHRRAAWAMLATGAAAAAASVLAWGVQPWRSWVSVLRPNALAWQTWTANTASLNGLFARLFAGGAFARPLVEAPALSRALTLGATLALVAVLVAASRRATRDAGDSRDRALLASWIAAVVVVNPLAWTHTVTIALVPLALLVGAAPTRPSPGVLAAIAIALTVPRETLGALAGPVPVGPGRGLALSLHAAAVVVLAGVGLSAAARAARAPDLAAPPARP